MDFEREKPYNDLPELPPKSEIETKVILKKTIKANTALAKLVGSARQLPNQSMLINSISLQEAKASSEIENVVTTNDELYQAYASEKKVEDPNTKEVLHYQDALWHGYQFVKDKDVITTNLLIDLMNIIKETNVGIRKTSGTRIKNPLTDEIIYSPPESEVILYQKTKNLENYINIDDDGIDPLIKMAVIHYQFEAIHPFHDGNGRTGRILNIIYLIYKDLLPIPILYLSKYILDNKKEYYKNIREITEQGKWEQWILYMLDAVELTSKYTQDKIDNILNLMIETKKFIRNEAPQIYSKELLEILFRHPYCKRKYLVQEGIVKEKTAGTYLKKLEKIGLLKSVKIGTEKLYINTKLFDVLIQ